MRVEQTSEQVSHNKWKWSVWLEGSVDELETVEHVIYRLHPSFSNPVVKRSDRGNNYRLDASGWGTFVIKIEVHLKNKPALQLTHRLHFDQDHPSVFVSAAHENKGDLEQVQEVMDQLQLEMASADDVDMNDDASVAIREKIDQAAALVLLGGAVPNRWILSEVETAKSLGKPIINVGAASFYNLEGTNNMQVETIAELHDVLAKLPHA